MNQRQLTYFITVMNHGSIKEAAQELMITPQGLSKTIIALEEEIGNQLFTRTKNGIKPTTYALNLKPHAISVLNAYAELNNNLAINNNGKTIFTVVAAYDFICLLDIAFFTRFYENNPNIQLNLVEMTDYPAIEKLKNNDVELAILSAPLDTTLFAGEMIHSANHCLIINNKNPLSKYNKIEYSDLKNQPLALKGREYAMYNSNINRFISAGTTPTIYIETSSDELIANLAEENLAIGVALDYMAMKNPTPNTVIRPFSDQTCKRTLYVAQNNNATLSKTAISFKSQLVEYFRKITE